MITSRDSKHTGFAGVSAISTCHGKRSARQTRGSTRCAPGMSSIPTVRPRESRIEELAVEEESVSEDFGGIG